MWKDDVRRYYIVPALDQNDVYFLFCPGGHEKKFGLSGMGRIIQYRYNVLWRPDRLAIKAYFGLKSSRGI